MGLFRAFTQRRHRRPRLRPQSLQLECRGELDRAVTGLEQAGQDGHDLGVAIRADPPQGPRRQGTPRIREIGVRGGLAMALLLFTDHAEEGRDGLGGPGTEFTQGDDRAPTPGLLLSRILGQRDQLADRPPLDRLAHGPEGADTERDGRAVTRSDRIEEPGLRWMAGFHRADLAPPAHAEKQEDRPIGVPRGDDLHQRRGRGRGPLPVGPQQVQSR